MGPLKAARRREPIRRGREQHRRGVVLRSGRVLGQLGAVAEVTPDISVIVACYNSAATLSATLASLRAQTHRNWEAVCVDDGSTDDTPGILHAEAMADARACGLHALRT